MATANETALNAELSRAFQQLRALNISITTERARGNVAGVEAMLPLYKTWLQRYKDISAQLGQLEFTAFDKFVLGTGNYVEAAANALPDAIAKLPVGIGQGILKASWPFVLLALGWLYFRGKI